MTNSYKFSSAASNLIGQPMFHIMQMANELEDKGYEVIHFELGDPDFSPSTGVCDAVTNALKNGMTHYTNSLGLDEFREALQIMLKSDLGLNCDYRQIVVTLGANSGIYWVLKCLLDEGSAVLGPDPQQR